MDAQNATGTRLKYEITTSWESPAVIEQLGTRRPDIAMHLEIIDGWINDSKAVLDMTRCTKEKFDYLAWLFEREIFERMPATKRLLFRGDPERQSDAGNRCLLRPRHVLFMSLYRKAYKLPQTVIGHTLGINQSTVSDYFRFARPIERKITPTPSNITEKAAQCKTRKEARRLLLGKDDGWLSLDGTRTEIQSYGPADPDPEHPEKGARIRARIAGEGKTFSGKTRMDCFNTLATCNDRDIIVCISDTHNGARHDSKLVSDIARKLPMLDDPDIPEEERIITYEDLGFKGIDDLMRGVIHILPFKKLPDLKVKDEKTGKVTKVKRKLTDAQKEFNRNQSRKRVNIECRFGRMSDYRIITDPYDIIKEEFNQEFDIVANLNNFDKLFEEIKAGTGIYGAMMHRRLGLS